MPNFFKLIIFSILVFPLLLIPTEAYSQSGNSTGGTQNQNQVGQAASESTGLSDVVKVVESVQVQTQAGIQTAVREQVKIRNTRIKEVQEERKTKMAEIRANYSALIQQRSQNQEQKLEQGQEQRLKMILVHGAKVEARLEKITDHFYVVIGRIDEHLTEQQDAGFDTSSLEMSLDSVENAVKALEVQISTFSSDYSALASMTDIETIKTELTTLKQSTRDIVAAAKLIKANIKSLVTSIR